jgi:hypothetical protein
VLQDLKRFQKEKEEDLRRYMVRFLNPAMDAIGCQNADGCALFFFPPQVAYARCHLDWARKNLETWTEAKDEVEKIVAR